MKRRTLLAGVGGVATVGTVGAIGVATLTDDCGPGETAIESLEGGSNNDVYLKGKVVEVLRGDSTFTIDDGTGTATIDAGMGPFPSKGQCLIVHGKVGNCVGCDENEHYITPAEYKNP